MENDKLITLSAFVDWIELNAFTSHGMYIKIKEYNDFLKTDLHLSHFIPTDENGKPLEKPTINTPVESAQFRMAMSDYQQAHEKVIFEGLETEIVRNLAGNYDYTIIYDNEGYKIHFSKKSILYKGQFIKTLADLAESTKSNPLTLKTKS